MAQMPVQNTPQKTLPQQPASQSTAAPTPPPKPIQSPPPAQPSIPSAPSKPSLPSLPKPKLSPPLLLALIALIVVALAVFLIVNQAKQNKIVKTQDGITVTAKEAQENLVQINKVRALSRLEADSNLEPAAEDAVIRKKLFAEVAKRGLTVTNEELNQELKTFSIWTNSQPITAQNIGQFGWSEADLKEWVRTKLLYQKLNDVVGTWREYYLIEISWEGTNQANQAKAESLLAGAKKRLEAQEEFKKVAESIKASLASGLEIYYSKIPTKRYDSASADVLKSLGEKAAFIESLRIPQKAEIFEEETTVGLYFVENYHQGEYPNVGVLLGGSPW